MDLEDLNDTIPQPIKQAFFADKTMPDLYSDYDVIGFDADHCIVKYNIEPLTKLMSRVMSEDLVANAGYPAQLVHIDETLMEMALNNCLWDVQNGTLLSLGQDRLVTRCFRGSKRCSSEQIEHLYGNPPVYRHLDWPASSK